VDCCIDTGTDDETKAFERTIMMMMMMLNFVFHVVRYGLLFLDVFTKLRNASVSFVMSLCLSISLSFSVEQLVSLWTDYLCTLK